ncbi:MAG: hypothetical protein ACTSU5_18950 [Promethearchaeota archaeon]
MDPDEMPQYHQYPNACGLTALLMALKPESPRRQIAPTLDLLWERIRRLFGEAGERGGRAGQEYDWQRVLEYLNVRCTFDEELRGALASDLGEAFHHYEAFERFQVDQALRRYRRSGNPEVQERIRRFEEDGTPFGDLLMARVYTMKHDIELKVLGRLFGCHFVPWPRTTDGTGSVYFTPGDGRDERSAAKKARFITDALEGGGSVLCGASHHWLAVREVRGSTGRGDLAVAYNDPMGGRREWSLRRLGPRHRFYCFRFHAGTREKYAAILTQVSIVL